MQFRVTQIDMTAQFKVDQTRSQAFSCLRCSPSQSDADHVIGMHGSGLDKNGLRSDSLCGWISCFLRVKKKKTGLVHVTYLSPCSPDRGHWTMSPANPKQIVSIAKRPKQGPVGIGADQFPQAYYDPEDEWASSRFDRGGPFALRRMNHAPRAP